MRDSQGIYFFAVYLDFNFEYFTVFCMYIKSSCIHLLSMAGSLIRISINTKNIVF